MTRIDVLNQKLKGLNETLKEKESVRNSLELSKREALVNFLGTYFDLEEGDVIKYDYEDSFSIERTNEYTSRKSNIFGIKFNKANWADNFPSSIGTSIYTTSEDSEFELNRLRSIGLFATTILDFKDDILSGYVEEVKKFTPLIDKAWKPIVDLTAQIRKVKQQIASLEKEEKLAQALDSGIEFENAKELEYRFNSYVRISKLKIEKVSASGKTASVQVKGLGWNGEFTRLYERVKMENILRVIL